MLSHGSAALDRDDKKTKLKQNKAVQVEVEVEVHLSIYSPPKARTDINTDRVAFLLILLFLTIFSFFHLKKFQSTI